MNRRNDDLEALLWLFFTMFFTGLAVTAFVGWMSGWWL